MAVYMIGDAVKTLGIEAHVLRYWEEELGLSIKRNSMGHRFYEERDVQLFEEIKRLRDGGVPLKDIKKYVEDIRKNKQNLDLNKNEGFKKNKSESPGVDKSESPEVHKNESHEENKNSSSLDKAMGKSMQNETPGNVVDFKIAQLQTLMNKIVANAFKENKQYLTNAIRNEVTSDVMRQIDIVIREQEEREEERFRKLDENLRLLQRANMEAAATKQRGLFRRKH